MSVDTYFCFCCLSTSDLLNLFSLENDENYAEMLKDLYTVEISQQEYEFDSYICRECADRLRDTLKFKMQVFQTMHILEGNGLIILTKTEANSVLVRKPTEDDDALKWKLRVQADRAIEEFLGLHTITDLNNAANVKLEKQSAEALQKITENLEPVTLRNEKRFTVSKKKVKEKLPEKPPPVVYQVTADLRCAHCDQQLPNAKVFHAHMNTHFPHHVCDTCGKGFLSAKRLKRHLPSHDKGPFTCAPPCGAQFTNYNTFCSHRQRKHTSGLLYACPHCASRFRTYTRRAHHLASAHAAAQARYRCPLCDARFLLSANLNSHVRNTHCAVRRHACAQCGAAFPQRRELTAHMARHTHANMHQCLHCHKSYARRNALVVHTRTHTGEKRFNCTHCGKGFNQKCTLLKHNKRHAKDGAEVKTSDVTNIGQGVVANVPNIGQDVVANVPNIGQDVVANVPNIGQDVVANVSNIGQHIVANVSNIGQEAANVSNIGQEAANVSNIGQVANVTNIKQTVSVVVESVRNIGQKVQLVTKLTNIEQEVANVPNIGQKVAENVPNIGLSVVANVPKFRQVANVRKTGQSVVANVPNIGPILVTTKASPMVQKTQPKVIKRKKLLANTVKIISEDKGMVPGTVLVQIDKDLLAPF